MNHAHILRIFSFIATLLLSTTAIAQNVSPDIQTFCNQHPDQVRELLDALDLNHDGLQPVKTAYQNQNLPKAAQALVDYYANRFPATKPERTNAQPPKAAEQILQDTFTIQQVTATIPRTGDGHLDWTHRGPRNDKEFAWLLNRHSHLRTLLRAYNQTGDPRFAETINDHIRGWYEFSPYPGKASRSAQWRGLEATLRMGPWKNVFTALHDTGLLQPSTSLMMLRSLIDHAHFLKNYHASGSNWITMEMNGLATIATTFPEFKQSGEWLDYATGQMTRTINEQVYPDGVQNELTAHYHAVTVGNFQRFYNTVTNAGRDLPNSFANTVENMWNYLAYVMRPDGSAPLNNDSDRDQNASRIINYAERFNRPDWTYIATNGEQGQRPGGPPSAFFPWAGQLVMRNNYSQNAHWAFFDIGPLGTGHVHYDKLHLSIHAYGRDILVDSGRYYYKNDKWRTHFKGTESHNTILIDGGVQTTFPSESEKPLDKNVRITPEYDYARGTFDNGYRRVFGDASHTRTVVYIRNKYWLVIDRIDTDRPRDITALWHFHPDCTVETENGHTFSTDEGKGNLRIQPINAAWNLDIVAGQEEPHIQGWYSVEYNLKEPNPTAVYKTRIANPAAIQDTNANPNTFAWLITPAKNTPPPAETAMTLSNPNTAEITIDKTTYRIPLTGKPTVESINPN